jgi:hypothetical protein
LSEQTLAVVWKTPLAIPIRQTRSILGAWLGTLPVAMALGSLFAGYFS